MREEVAFFSLPCKSRVHLMTDFQGKRILVTRPSGQSRETIDFFVSRGAAVVHIPFIHIIEASDGGAALDRAIANIRQYDWLIFTSQNAVRHFFSRSLAPAAEELTLKIAAVGEKTESLLKRLGMNSLVVADVAHAEGLAEKLSLYDLSGKRILFPRAKDGNETLVELLTQRGADVHVVEAYRTIMPPDLDRKKFITLITEQKIDIVHFCSPSAVKNFFRILQEENLRNAISSLEFLAMGPTTEKALTLQRSSL